MPFFLMASRNAVGVRFTEKRPIGSLSSVNLVQALGTPEVLPMAATGRN